MGNVMIGAFPKINALGTKYVQDVFMEEVEITEKLDGSQFGWGKVNGELVIRSKGAIINQSAPDNLFNEGVAYIKSIEEMLPDNTFFYGEYFKKPKHNTICYDRIPTHHIALFGVVSLPDQFADDHATLVYWATKFEIEAIPLLYRGMVPNKEFVKQFMDTVSRLGGAKVEGIVVKNYQRGVRLTSDYMLPIMCAKLVSEEFKEVHRGRWKDEETKGGKLEQFYNGFRTPARWAKAVQHLRERGDLTETPKDIGALFKEVSDDIEAEEKEFIMEQLYLMHRKDLLKRATDGMPQWYKEQLMGECMYLEG